MSNYAVDGTVLSGIADAIRLKRGTVAGMEVTDMANEISLISGGGGGGTSPIGDLVLTYTTTTVIGRANGFDSFINNYICSESPSIRAIWSNGSVIAGYMLTTIFQYDSSKSGDYPLAAVHYNIINYSSRCYFSYGYGIKTSFGAADWNIQSGTQVKFYIKQF